MILEIAQIQIKKGENAAFEKALRKAEGILKQAQGYVSHEFKRCMEIEQRYILLINWETLEAHTEGFRKSALFANWRELIGPFFEEAPEVYHYELI